MAPAPRRTRRREFSGRTTSRCRPVKPRPERTLQQTSVDRVNAIDKTTETRTIPGRGARAQSVSIAVDEEAAAGLDAGTNRRPLAAAAGIDTERGDKIQVELVTFAAASADAATAALEEGKAAEAQAQMQELLQTGIIAGAVVIVLVVLIVTLSRGRKRRADAVDVGDVPASPVGPTTLDAVDDQPAVAGYPQAPAVAAPTAPVAPLAPAPRTTSSAPAPSSTRSPPPTRSAPPITAPPDG